MDNVFTLFLKKIKAKLLPFSVDGTGKNPNISGA
jgi:hypothetical protein